MKATITLGVIAPLFIMAASGKALATQPGSYMGVGIGYSSVDNFTDTIKTNDADGIGARLFAGHQFNDRFGLEAGLIKYTTTDYLIKGYPGIRIHYRLQALSLVGKRVWSLSEDKRLNIYTSLGAAYVFGIAEATNGTESYFSAPANGFVAQIGAGLSYVINPQMTASLDYTRSGSKAGNIDHFAISCANLLSVNVAYQFM